MERLTDKFKCKYNTGKIVNAHNASKQQVIDKLSEYEDTGLTPQEVEKLIKENAELKAKFEKSVESYEGLKEDEYFIQTKFGWCFYSLINCPLIYNLYVHPKYRRCGHSRTLLQCVINSIRENGYDGIIQIQATPREGSIELADLAKYYKSMGLVILKERVLNG